MYHPNESPTLMLPGDELLWLRYALTTKVENRPTRESSSICAIVENGLP